MGRKTHGPYLIAAIEHNDHEKVGEILTSHIRPKEKVKELCYSDIKRLASEHTECPLLLAACLPDAAILGYLVKKHDVNINYVKKIQVGRRTKTKTALITAVRNGLYDTVEGILGLQADANIQDHKGRSALHHAVRKADYRMAKMLLTRGANANLTDQGENTPLHVATIFGHSELVKMLLHFDADQYKKGQHGAIPIHIAAKEGHKELLKLYSAKQMNPNIKMPCYDGREKAPLHVAAEGGHYECISLLINEIGADINVHDSEGETPLTSCCLNEYDPMGMKSKDDYTECVRILIKNGADVNQQNGRGETVLHLASRNEFHKIVDVLVQAGADPLITDNNGDKPIDLVSPDDTVSRQTLKQAQEDRERYLNDRFEIDAKGYSTSLKHIPGRANSSLSIDSSVNGSFRGRTASMPGLLEHNIGQQGRHPIIEENYLEPQRGGNNTYANIPDNLSDDSYAAEKNDDKSGSVSSLSQILANKLTKPTSRSVRTESSDSSHYEEASLKGKMRSKSVDVIGNPSQYPHKNFSHPNTPQKPGGRLGSPPPTPPGRPRDPRESITTQVSVMTDATSVWDDSVSRTSSISTFVPDTQKTQEKLRQIKENFKSRGNRFDFPSDSTSQYETLPEERPPAQMKQPQPTTNIGIKSTNNNIQARTATPTMSDSDETFFDDESFDTLSESFWKKPEIKPKPKLKAKDLQKKALANQQKESQKKKKTSPKDKDNPALQSWLSEQAEIMEQRDQDGTPPVVTKRNLVPPKAEEESSTVDITASPGVKHRARTFEAPKAPPRPAPRGKPTIPPKANEEEKVVHVEVDEGSTGQTLIRLTPLKGGKGVAQVELPANARNVKVLEEKENNNNLKHSMEVDDSEDGLTNDSTFDDESDEEEDAPNSGHHAAILYDSQRQMQPTRTQIKIPSAPTTPTAEKAKPKFSTFFEPAATSTMKDQEPIPSQRFKGQQDASDTSSSRHEDEQDSFPQYASVNKSSMQNGGASRTAPVAKIVPVSAPYAAPARTPVVAPVVGQVHTVPVVGQVQRVIAVPRDAPPKVPSAETSHEQIYHEITHGYDSPSDEAKRKSVTIGNDVYIPNNVKRPPDFDHRKITYNTMGQVPFSLVGGNADGVFVHRLEVGSPAQKAGLLDGDLIVKVNDQRMKGKTREEVSLLLNSMKAMVNMTVRHKKDRYKAILENGGMGDSFFVKANFNFAEPRSEEMNIHEGDIFGIRDTLPDGKVGSWLGLKVNASASENQHGLIPNNNRAEQVAINQRLAAIKAKEKQQRGGLLRRSFGRSKSVDRLNKSRDREDIDFNPRDVIAYERVQQKSPEFMQPVVLLGLFCDAVRDSLRQDSPGIFEVPEQDVEYPAAEGNAPLINMNLLHRIVHENKHCLTIISPKAIEFLQKTELKPIVIYLHPGNKSILKAIRNKMAPDFDRKINLMLDEASVFEKANKHLFTATVTYTSDDNWFTLLKDTIHRIQNQPQWVPMQPEQEDEDDEDEEDMESPRSQQKLSRKMNASCDDIPDQIADILNRHATGRPQRSESSGSETGIPKPPHSTLTYDGYFLSANQQEAPKEKPPPTPTQPAIEVISDSKSNPKSILRGRNGDDASSSVNGDSASLSSTSSATSAPKPVHQVRMVGGPVSHSSPNTTPPRPQATTPTGPAPGFQPMQVNPGIRHAPIQKYNQPQPQPQTQSQPQPQKQRGRQRIRSQPGGPGQQPQGNQGMHPGMQQPQGMHPGMQQPQGMHPGMQQPQGMHPGMQQPQGMHAGMQPRMQQPQAQLQGMQQRMQQPQGMHPGMPQPQGMHPGMQPRMQQPQGMQPRMQQPQGMQPRMQQPQGMHPGMQQPQGMHPGMQPRMQQPQGIQPRMQQTPGMHPGMQQHQGMRPGMPPQQRMPGMQQPPRPTTPGAQSQPMYTGQGQQPPRMQRQNTETTL